MGILKIGSVYEILLRGKNSYFATSKVANLGFAINCKGNSSHATRSKGEKSLFFSLGQYGYFYKMPKISLHCLPFLLMESLRGLFGYTMI